MQQHYQPPAPSQEGATPVCAQIDRLTLLTNKLLLKMFSFLVKCRQFFFLSFFFLKKAAPEAATLSTGNTSTDSPKNCQNQYLSWILFP